VDEGVVKGGLDVANAEGHGILWHVRSVVSDLLFLLDDGSFLGFRGLYRGKYLSDANEKKGSV
jgi:hypothetical protein